MSQHSFVFDGICGAESICATCQLEQVENKLAESQAVSVMPSNETVASVRGCLASTAQQPDNNIFEVFNYPFVTSRGSKLIGLSLTFHHGWILDSFQMGDATCYSQSCFGLGLGEIQNIK